MTKERKPKRSGPNGRRAKYQPLMCSAPHQSKNPDSPEAGRQYVLKAYRPEKPSHRIRPYKRSDLRRGMFPEAHGVSFGKLLLILLLPYISIYIYANAIPSLVENGWVEPESMMHSTLCIGLDMTVSAGFAFEVQFARSKCKQTWGRDETAAHSNS